jgi:prevent-host-death family protein
MAKNTLSALIRRIRGGTSITITDRGIPVARLVPPANVRGLSPAVLELAQRGLLRLPDKTLSPDWSAKLPRPQLRKGKSAVQDVIAERRSGW